ncbi:MAG: hypothetical protein JWM11_5477 [Planctomycetaceae bacterium]|nr:hypothetical protein [Planctomycetaceae bacterium]
MKCGLKSNVAIISARPEPRQEPNPIRNLGVGQKLLAQSAGTRSRRVPDSPLAIVWVAGDAARKFRITASNSKRTTNFKFGISDFKIGRIIREQNDGEGIGRMMCGRIMTSETTNILILSNGLHTAHG